MSPTAQKIIREIEKEIRIASSYGAGSTIALVHDEATRQEVQDYFMDKDYLIRDSSMGDPEIFYVQWRY